MFSQTIFIPAEQHFDELTALWEASVRATHHFLPEEDILFFRPLIRNEYLRAVRLFAILTLEGSIAGFSGLSEDTLEMLFVRPDYLGKRIGKLLLLHAIGEGITKIDVNEQNPDALAFYQHFGFEIAGRSPVDPLGKPYPVLHLELAR